MKTVVLKEKETTVQSALVSHPKLWRIVPIGRICAIGHAYAVGAHQWNEIYVYKISDSKHIDGNKA